MGLELNGQEICKMVIDPRFVQTAVEIVLRAGEIQMSRLGRDLRVDKKGPIDLVTEVDVEIEIMCRDSLAEYFPSHEIMGEELGNSMPGPNRRTSHRWIFDPIDGTVNFAHGLPIFCSSLALEVEGQVVVGAVYDPTRQELFVAERGGGARLNGALMSVSTSTDLLDAMLCTGFPYDVHETVDEVVGLFRAFVGRAQAVRRLGSAALDLCYVAAGRFDGFWEQRLKPWDTAAGAFIVEEAGGQVSDLQGQLFLPMNGSVLASNKHIHDQMLKVIKSAGLSFL